MNGSFRRLVRKDYSRKENVCLGDFFIDLRYAFGLKDMLNKESSSLSKLSQLYK